MAGSIKINFTDFTTEDVWVHGNLFDQNEQYEFSAEVYDNPSRYGINKSRVSKLLMYDNNKNEILFYEREWVQKPTTELISYYHELLKSLDTCSKRFS